MALISAATIAGAQDVPLPPGSGLGGQGTQQPSSAPTKTTTEDAATPPATDAKTQDESFFEREFEKTKEMMEDLWDDVKGKKTEQTQAPTVEAKTPESAATPMPDPKADAKMSPTPPVKDTPPLPGSQTTTGSHPAQTDTQPDPYQDESFFEREYHKARDAAEELWDDVTGHKHPENPAPDATHDHPAATPQPNGTDPKQPPALPKHPMSQDSHMLPPETAPSYEDEPFLEREYHKARDAVEGIWDDITGHKHSQPPAATPQEPKANETGSQQPAVKEPHLPTPEPTLPLPAPVDAHTQHNNAPSAPPAPPTPTPHAIPPAHIVAPTPPPAPIPPQPSAPAHITPTPPAQIQKDTHVTPPMSTPEATHPSNTDNSNAQGPNTQHQEQEKQQRQGLMDDAILEDMDHEARHHTTPHIKPYHHLQTPSEPPRMLTSHPDGEAMPTASQAQLIAFVNEEVQNLLAPPYDDVLLGELTRHGKDAAMSPFEIMDRARRVFRYVQEAPQKAMVNQYLAAVKARARKCTMRCSHDDVIAAVKDGSLDEVRMMLHASNTHEIITATGDTLLNIAVRNRRYDLVEYFLWKGIDPKRLNKDGVNAIMIAKEMGDKKMYELLTSRRNMLPRK